MDEQMLAQIQQMLTTATDTLRQDFRQEMAAMEARLVERIEGVEQVQRNMEARLVERIEEAKRHSGVLVEGLRHELQLVAEGLQMHIERHHQGYREHVDRQFAEQRAFMQTAYRELNERIERHEQSHHA